jgi:hypothetical protein
VNHADVKNHLAEYLEGELDLGVRALVDAHLDGCSDCAADVDQMQQTIRLLRMLPDPQTPPMIAANVMRRIRAGETSPSFFGRIGRMVEAILEPSFVLPAAGLAAAALAVVVVQDPSALSRLGFDSRSRDGASNLAGTDPFLTFGESRSPTGGSANPSFLGTPTARETRIAVTPGDRIGTPIRVFDATPNRIRVELAPIALPPSRWSLESMGSPRMPEALVADSGGGFPGMRPGAGGWVPASGGLVWPAAQTTPSGGFAWPAAQTQGNAFGPLGVGATVGESSGGEDKRDEWIARGLADPAGFSRYIASQNLAEQELWVDRLTRRAETQGQFDALVSALRESGDPAAAMIAADFAAESARLRSEESSAAAEEGAGPSR